MRVGDGSHPTLPSFMESRMDATQALLYNTVEEDFWARHSSHSTHPLLWRVRLDSHPPLISVEEDVRVGDGSHPSLPTTLHGGMRGWVIGPILPPPLLWRVACD